jgi:hypothetical protein
MGKDGNGRQMSEWANERMGEQQVFRGVGTMWHSARGKGYKNITEWKNFKM